MVFDHTLKDSPSIAVLVRVGACEYLQVSKVSRLKQASLMESRLK